MTRTLIPKIRTYTDWRSDKAKGKAWYGSAKRRMHVGSDVYAFVLFGFPADLLGASVSSAVLRGVPAGVTVQRHAALGNRVSYSDMTGRNQPGTLAGSSAFTDTEADGTVDLRSDVQAIANGGAYHGYLLTLSGAIQHFGGAVDAAITLDLEYAHAPQTPTGLSPAGQVVSLAAPPVQFTPDVNGLTALQVQVDVVGGDYSAPLHDSGWIATTTASYDLAAGGWAGVSTGTAWQWRVRQRNVLGDSDFSASVVVTRVAKPSDLAWVTVPTATGDPTPLHEWTVSGQVRYLLRVVDRTTGAVLYDSGWIPGDEDGKTPTSGPTRDGQLVQSQLYVQDRDDRAKNIPADPPWLLLTPTGRWTCLRLMTR